MNIQPGQRFKGIKCLLFDCFGTVFDMSSIPRGQIAAYVEHVRKEDFSPYEFPQEWWQLKAHPDAAEGIETIWRKMAIACCAFSNGSHELISHISGMSGISWDFIYNPTLEKAYKPSPKAYKAMHAITGYEPHECLMVTANPTFGDVERATSVGMQAVVIRHGKPNDIIELAQMIDDGYVEMKE